MNRRDFIRWLEANGCVLVASSGRGPHDKYRNTATGATAPVPRHRTLGRGLVRTICRQLGIPSPL